MTNDPPPPPRSPMAGGAPLALLTILGAILGGLLFGQPTIGLLVGFGLGVLIAIAIWLRSR